MIPSIPAIYSLPIPSLSVWVPFLILHGHVHIIHHWPHVRYYILFLPMHSSFSLPKTDQPLELQDSMEAQFCSEPARD